MNWDLNNLIGKFKKRNRFNSISTIPLFLGQYILAQLSDNTAYTRYPVNKSWPWHYDKFCTDVSSTEGKWTKCRWLKFQCDLCLIYITTKITVVPWAIGFLVSFICDSYLLYSFFEGTFINKYYFPVFIPIGIMGNILSFLVSVLTVTKKNILEIILSLHVSQVT